MKAAILAGGYGTRLSEEPEADDREIGGMAIVWTIMKSHSETEGCVLRGLESKETLDD